jgi:hydroxyacylglutathione hydrolase
MKIKQFRYNADNLGYLVYGETSAVAIDGGDAESILSFISERNLSLKYVTNTHSHPDHTVGNQLLLNQSKASFLDFRTLLKSSAIEIDGEKIRVSHTPGHTDDSVCFHYGRILLSGDTLFNGKVGRCFTGDHNGFLKSIKKLLALPRDTMVYAGHDYVEEYMAFSRNLEPDNPDIDRYLKTYDPNHVCARLGDEIKVDPFLRFNDEKIMFILRKKGFPVKTELERWESLMSLI